MKCFLLMLLIADSFKQQMRTFIEMLSSKFSLYNVPTLHFNLLNIYQIMLFTISTGNLCIYCVFSTVIS
jgi:hypothetical protein